MKKTSTKKNGLPEFLLVLVLGSAWIFGNAQQIVPVRLEPRHVPEVQNKYMRVINAQIEDGDTSLFHVHEIPSAFVFMTDVVYDNQVLGQPWQKAPSEKGYAWYSSFASGPAIHRVAAPKGEKIHAYDVEILSRYGLTRGDVWMPLLKDTLFVSDRCAGYRVEVNALDSRFEFKGRGPMVAIHLSGNGFTVTQSSTKIGTVANNGYVVIRPDLETTIQGVSGQNTKLILFEIR